MQEYQCNVARMECLCDSPLDLWGELCQKLWMNSVLRDYIPPHLGPLDGLGAMELYPPIYLVTTVPTRLSVSFVWCCLRVAFLLT